MACVDMRGFRYPLEPLRKRGEWQLDAAMTELAAVRKKLQEVQELEKRLDEDTSAQASLAAQAWQRRSDPVTHTRLLTYLAQLQERKSAMAREIASLQEQVAAAQQNVVARQQHVETLERHRTEIVNAHRLQQERKSSAEADQEWTSRNAALQGAHP